jgi:hypothetical protein
MHLQDMQDYRARGEGHGTDFKKILRQNLQVSEFGSRAAFEQRESTGSDLFTTMDGICHGGF